MERVYCQAHGKNSYDKRGAEEVRNAAWRERKAALRIYECPDCGAWHVTSRDAEERGGRKRVTWRQTREK
jgi:hypothetical protein